MLGEIRVLPSSEIEILLYLLQYISTAFSVRSQFASVTWESGFLEKKNQLKNPQAGCFALLVAVHSHDGLSSQGNGLPGKALSQSPGWLYLGFESMRGNTKRMVYEHSKDSEQTGHLPSLFKGFAVQRYLSLLGGRVNSRFPRLISKFVILYWAHSTLCWFWQILVHLKIA